MHTLMHHELTRIAKYFCDYQLERPPKKSIPKDTSLLAPLERSKAKRSNFQCASVNELNYLNNKASKRKPDITYKTILHSFQLPCDRYTQTSRTYSCSCTDCFQINELVIEVLSDKLLAFCEASGKFYI